MTFWKRTLILACLSVAVFLLQGSLGAAPAEAALYKFTFTSDQVNGYFVYDTDAEGETKSAYMTQYYGAGRDFKVDLNEKGVFDGPVSNAIVFLARQEDKTLAKIKAEHDETYGKNEEQDALVPKDLLLLQVRSFERQPKSKYSLVSYFKYPKDTFQGSTELPTHVPAEAEIEVFPTVEFPKTLGRAVFKGLVKTKVEKISD